MTAYPALVAYIHDRNLSEGTRDWYDRLCEDKAAAEGGAFADLAADLERAEADYATLARAKGHDGYPYNSAMGEFLGLPLGTDREPRHGYYMACGVASHHKLGEAKRAVERLIAEGKPLLVVTARAKATNKPVRFARYAGPDQIKIEGGTIRAMAGKRGHHLSSNWSVETCLVKVARAMASGVAYGEA